jgi:hypothetical protein
MEQTSFEQAILATLRQIPEKRRSAILNIVQTLARELKEPEPATRKRHYNVERHQEIRRLTATIRGSLAAAISAERDERG